MSYVNIPGVKGSIVDGKLPQGAAADEPKVLVLGTAKSGLSDEPWQVGSLSRAEREFTSSSDLLRGAHEVVSQGASNISLVRSGGRTGTIVITDSTGGSLTVTPIDRDGQALAKYALILESDGSGGNRVVVYDLTNKEWVFDSENVLVFDDGIVEVVDDSFDTFTLNSLEAPDSATSLAAIVSGDFTATGSSTLSSITRTDGDDGITPSLVERYAALNSTYHYLDYKDGDLIYPVGVFVDDNNIADGLSGNNSTYGLFWKGLPIQKALNDYLGYLWQWIYQGKLYTFFTDSATYFTSAESAANATRTVDTDIVLTALVPGKGGNAVTIQINAAGAAGPTVTVTETVHGFDILVVDDGTATRQEAIDAINEELETTTLDNGVLASTLIEATLRSGGSGSTTINTVAKVNLASGTGGHMLTHQDLTGDDLPTEVLDRFENDGVDAELRECNFAHQLASFCDLASVDWSPMIGFISFKAPTGYGRGVIAEWIGVAPDYIENTESMYIDAVADNGVGILGNKFMSGKAISSAGYRADLVVGGDATDGLAFGGWIKTVGASLPNGEDFPYGIDDADEALDENNAPVDIGKFLVITGDWPIQRNGFNGGTAYRGPIAGNAAGTVAITPPNILPIGLSGRVLRVIQPPRVHASQLNQLARARITFLRRDESTQALMYSSMDTAAHPNSDYALLTTTRCMAKHLKDLKSILTPYISKGFNVESRVSMQSDIDSYLQQARIKGYNAGARARLVFTRADKIAGRMTVRLQFVPPFSIKTITVVMSVAADESELS